MANIIIIGASRGIGFELVQQLGADHKVLALSRSTDKLRSVASSNIMVEAFDLTSNTARADLKGLIEKHLKSVDLVINNAGYLVNAPLLDLTDADIDQMMATNVTGIIKACQTVVPFMATNSHIVNIGSMGGFQGSAKFPGLSTYSASKAALASFTECLAEELKDKHISANCLALGAAQTEMLEMAFPGYEAPVSASKMAAFIGNFGLTGHQWINGKVLPVSLSTP